MYNIITYHDDTSQIGTSDHHDRDIFSDKSPSPPLASPRPCLVTNPPRLPPTAPQRILVATNLFGRGMDIERVNIVFNYDMPEDSDTYLHRVARAGRFGTKGLAITFISDEANAKILNDVQDRFDVNITELPDEIDLSSYSECLWQDIGKAGICDVENVGA